MLVSVWVVKSTDSTNIVHFQIREIVFVKIRVCSFSEEDDSVGLSGNISLSHASMRASITRLDAIGCGEVGAS